MDNRGLLHKTNFNLITVIVLCIYFLLPPQLPKNSVVQAQTPIGTEPLVTIFAPKTDTVINTKEITVSGTVENFESVTSVSIFSENESIGATNSIVENTWNVTVPLKTGENNLYAIASGTDGKPSLPSPTIKITVDITVPTIEFSNQKEGAFSNSNSIEMMTEPGSSVQICLDCTESTGGELEGNWIPVLENLRNSGNFVYQDAQMKQGKHTVFAKATDRAGNLGPPKSISFILDTLRPVILPSSLEPKSNMSQVAVDKDNTKFKFKILDANAINELELQKSLTLTKSGSSTPIPVIFVGYTEATKEVIFELTQPLIRSTKYHISINPSGVLDSAGNRAFPRIWSFTTESISFAETNRKVYEVAYNNKTIHRESPHGIFSGNFNTCANCHSTHAASNPKLLDQKKNSENDNRDLTVDLYCMACHDGTVAPLPENNQSTHSHNAGISMDGTLTGSSCSSCHNPHSELSTANPNLTQGHFIYKHDDTLPQPGKPSGEISSKSQLCETCHDAETAEKLGDPRVEYQLFEYKNANTAIGVYEDYGLCLRCHNPDYQSINNDTAKAADIAQYYSNLTKQVLVDYEEINGESSFTNRDISPAELVFSGHTIKAQDGSPLAGHIPCADCHDTHGSSNIKQLKTVIGHENQQTFKIENGDWTPAVERSFCLKCHNGTTAIYGVTGKIPDTVKSDGHLETEANKDIPCSNCHGIGADAKEKAMNAAHAPRKAMPALSKLEVGNHTLSPKFSPYSLNYTVKVENTISSINIIAESKDSNNAVSGTGTKALNVGLNVFTVTVKSLDGKETTYTITIKRTAPKT
ncbi:Ig-like domain-containing protein [Bacillus sp. FJAT-27445]|uniref:Ig-like domain-containing protein n=1 Tax=Bacillus sp. FJAT-27445 TaxID=1679166 RepID=UPI000743ECC9|nr:Ig-like domain-containing protein [Bacillus sp. FJAT-27445]